MSLSRLQELFESRGFVVNNYFTYQGYYKLIEIINFKSAVSLMILIEDKHKIPSQKLKHEYEILQKKLNNETQTTLGALTNEGEIRSTYREIDHITKALESESKLQDIYDKPISLKGEEDRSLEKFESSVRQLKRFRLCVKNISYKFILFDDDCICLLNSESEIETYYAVDYRHRKRKIFVLATLETFFNTDDVEHSVRKINEQFHLILDDNQKLETSKIQTMIDSKQNIVKQSKKILDMKKKLYLKIQNSEKYHETLLEKIKTLKIKKKEIEEAGMRKTTSDTTLTVEKIVSDIEKIDEEQRITIKSILDTRKELDELCLVVDNILFDNMVMLSKIAHNFRVLETLKIG